MGSAPKPPSPPDPKETAAAQGQMNRETAITQYLLGATDQVTPFGSLTYEPVGTWANTSLNPNYNPSGDSAYTSTALSSGGGAAGFGRLPTLADAPGMKANQRSYDALIKSGVAPNVARSMVNGTGVGTGAGGSASTRSGGGNGGGNAAVPDYLNTPRFRAVQTLAPDLQATVDNYLSTARNLSGTVSDTLSKQFDTSTLPARAGAMTGGDGLIRNVSLADVPLDLSWNGPQARYTIDNAGPIQRNVGADDFSEDRRRVEEALLSRINPSLERDRDRLDADLRARGIGIGTRAYDRSVDELNRQGTDARMAAILSGGQEQSRLAGLEINQGNFRNAAQAQQYGQNANDATFFNAAQAQNFGQSLTADQFRREGIGINNNTALAGAGFANQAQNQGFNQNLAAAQFNNSNRSSALEEAAFLRSLPLNEISALLNGTQLAGPKFTNTPQPGVAGVDYTGLVGQQYQGQLQAYNAAQQNRAGMLGGLAGIGSSLIGAFSDRRLKDDIQPIDAKLGRFQLYSYRYKGMPHLSFGVMADEVEAVMPEAVTERDGFKAVRYDMLEAA